MFFQTLKYKEVTDTYFSVFCFHVRQAGLQITPISKDQLWKSVLSQMCRELKIREETIMHSGKIISVTAHRLFKQIQENKELDKHLVSVIELWRLKKTRDALYVAGDDYRERTKAMLESIMTFETAKEEISDSYKRSKEKYTKKFPDIMKIYGV